MLLSTIISIFSISAHQTFRASCKRISEKRKLILSRMNPETTPRTNVIPVFSTMLIFWK